MIPLRMHTFLIISVIYLTAVSCAINKELESVLNERLEKLRMKMREYNISAYIIPNEDDHQNEFTAAPDNRKEYISGFSGSAGFALITLDNATLWTDGRYYLQAENQLPSSWTLMRRHFAIISDISPWLIENIKPGDTVAADPKKITAVQWKKLNDTLKSNKIHLLALEHNLIDELWADRPTYSNDPLYIHELIYCGEPYYSKLERLRKRLKTLNSDALVLSQLDEIAWLYNLRGNDLLHSPMFLSFSIITNNSATLYISENRINSLIEKHLANPGGVVELKPYHSFWNDLKSISQSRKNIFIPSASSYAVHLTVPEKMIVSSDSPIIDMKAAKNDVEVQGSRNAHIRDAIAICALFKQIEEEVSNGIHWDEIKIAEELDKLREKYGQGLYKGPSFNTIAAFGPNSALPHYTSSLLTNVTVNTSAPLTLDSGGQYLDGTIDTTRVVHFGTPTEFQKQIYTALLQGVIDLADTVFFDGTPSQHLEILIKRPLLKLGLTFPHGTTHGTGVFANVHEDYNKTLFENFIGSQEPGYYLKNNFGMRLENLVVVIKAKVQEKDNSKKLLTFSPLTLVPYEQKLINISLLNQDQILWVNNYHDTIKQTVGNEMTKLGEHDLVAWLEEKTKPIVI